MKFEVSITTATFIIIGIGIIQFLLAQWTKSRIDASIKAEYAKILEDYRFDIKTREQAIKVAEYMSIARNLKESSLDEDYRKANQLAWELAMWLPTDVYKKLGQALSSPNKEINPLSVSIEIRKMLLKDKAGDLTQDNIIHHAPGIGKNR